MIAENCACPRLWVSSEVGREGVHDAPHGLFRESGGSGNVVDGVSLVHVAVHLVSLDRCSLGSLFAARVSV